MKNLLFALPAMLALTGCVEINTDPGPVRTSEQSLEAGKADNLRAELRMGAGKLHVEGGGKSALDATFRYSENLGKPDVRYEQTGFRGRIVVESQHKKVLHSNVDNEWKLRFGDKLPIDFDIKLGAGETSVDLSALPVRNVEINMGVGELDLNLNGAYKRDVDVKVHGGVGEARIQLPKNIGVIVDAAGGIGEINAKGLEKRDGKYVNAAYDSARPVIRMNVRGGVGEIHLTVVE
ncbi:MAG: toast rack family protein [Bryobacteraceae bacterium]